MKGDPQLDGCPEYNFIFYTKGDEGLASVNSNPVRCSKIICTTVWDEIDRDAIKALPWSPSDPLT